jgi:NADH-quinone oxidoreductase subunit D
MAYGLQVHLRAAGVDYVRVANLLTDFDFIIPVGKSGDTYDRFVFVMQVWEKFEYYSSSIRKCRKEMFHADVPDYYLPQRRCLHKYGIVDLPFQNCMGEVPVPVAEYIILLKVETEN